MRVLEFRHLLSSWLETGTYNVSEIGHDENMQMLYTY